MAERTGAAAASGRRGAADLPEALLEELRAQRWFAAKGRALAGAVVLDSADLGTPDRPVRFELAEVRYESGEPETYLLVRGDEDLDALADPRVARALIRHVYGQARLPTERGGAVAFWHGDVLQDVPLAALEPASPLGADQSNSSIRYGDALLLKVFRRPRPGIHPDIEVAQFLTDRTEFRHMPLLVGTVSYRAPDGAISAMGMLQTFVRNEGNAWTGTLRRLEQALADGSLAPAIAPITRLGEVTAEMHLALASRGDPPAFAPEPVNEADVAAWKEGVDAEVLIAVRALQERAEAVDERRLAVRETGLEGLLGSLKTRFHGDYHLGQVLERDSAGMDVAIIDFEGEPSKPLEARREKRSPLRDVAGMLRSLDYARHAALRSGDSGDTARAAAADEWHTAARATFMRAYIRNIHHGNRRLLPADEGDMRRALSALELERAAYEVLYELNNRPELLSIPLTALTA